MRSIEKSGMIVRSMGILTLLVLATMLLGCDDSTQVQTAAPALSDAKVSVAGQSLDGLTIRQGEYDGVVRYEARLVDAQGEPMSGYRVRVQVAKPGMMGGMHPSMDEFYCYDDSTHGDPMPGDGVYCYADSSQEYGCHRAGAQFGSYHYDFCGVDGHGHESNHMGVRVRLQQ